jgi:hypothetical protein
VKISGGPPRNYYRSSNLKIPCERREINTGLCKKKEKVAEEEEE